MSVLLAMLLGLVQGLCEFLPVSSSGHLVLLQNIFGVEEGALFFDTMLHVGTLVAVLVVFRKTIWDLIRHPLQTKVYMLAIATIATAVIALVFESSIEKAYEGRLLGAGFLFTAMVLQLQKRFSGGKRTVESLTPLQAAGIGLMQGIAILPGISRSGSTIAGASFYGLNKDDAAEFSFLLSIPAILGSLVLQAKDVLETGVGDASWPAILLGTAVAALSGYFAIRWMLKLIKTKDLSGFSFYLLILGVLVLCDQLFINAFFPNPFV